MLLEICVVCYIVNVIRCMINVEMIYLIYYLLI